MYVSPGKMKYTRQDFITGLECILEDDAMKSVTVFCGNLADVKQRIRITRRGKPKLNELLISERNFLKLCKKAKTKPRKVWFHFYPKKK